MRWEREEDILILEVYFKAGCRAVGRDHSLVNELSQFTNRPLNSLAMRTGNFAAVDPKNPSSGLLNYARQTKEVWDQFHSDPERLMRECKRIRQDPKFKNLVAGRKS